MNSQETDREQTGDYFSLFAIILKSSDIEQLTPVQ